MQQRRIVIDPKPDQYDSCLVQVSETITKVEMPGDCFTSGVFSHYPLPGLVIHDLGEVPLPLRDCDLKDLMSKSQSSPCGQGEQGQACINPNARNLLELNADKFQMANPQWAKLISTIKKTIAASLGISEKIEFEAQPCKLLLLGKGGIFPKPQSYEEKTTAGMFGTLLVTLPCQFQGAELHVHHPSRPSTETHEWSPTSMKPDDLKYAAYYIDCEIEMTPVTSGYYLCLMYKLVAISSTAVPRFGGNHELYARFEAALDEYFLSRSYKKDNDNEARRPKKIARVSSQSGDIVAGKIPPRDTQLVYIVQHKYTSPELSFEYIKGKDKMIAQCLAKYSTEKGRLFNLYLCKVRYDDSFDIREEYDDVEKVFTETRGANRTKSVTLKSQRIKYGEDQAITFGAVFSNREEEIVPVGFFENVVFDDTAETCYSEFNDPRQESWYKSAALVLQPKPSVVQNTLSKATKS